MTKDGLRFLGDGEDRSQFDVAGNLLRDANSRLKSLEDQFRQRTISADLGPQLIEARNRYETLLTAYIYAYGAAFGPPDTTGLEGFRRGRGLGQWQVYVASGVGIAVILAGIYELNNYLNVLEQRAKTQAAAQQQASDLENQAAAAYSSGNLDLGDKLTTLAEQQKNFGRQAPSWLMPVAIGAGVVGVILLLER